MGRVHLPRHAIGSVGAKKILDDSYGGPVAAAVGNRGGALIAHQCVDAWDSCLCHLVVVLSEVEVGKEEDKSSCPMLPKHRPTLRGVRCPGQLMNQQMLDRELSFNSEVRRTSRASVTGIYSSQQQ